MLLLRAAHEPTPWTGTVASLAMDICKHLHFLPLALIHAGQAIVTNACKLANYIAHFDDEADRIHRERHRRRRRRLQSPSSDSQRARDDRDSMNVYGSYEILHQSSLGPAKREERFKDALQLLHIFSYMHFQNIRLGRPRPGRCYAAPRDRRREGRAAPRCQAPAEAWHQDAAAVLAGLAAGPGTRRRGPPRDAPGPSRGPEEPG